MVACALSVVILAGCASPAGLPAPPVELPSPIVLKLVEFDELRIDLSTLTSGAAPSLAKVVNPGDDVSEYIGRYAERIASMEENILIPITEGLGAIDIPVSESIQAFEGEVAFTQLSSSLLDTFFGTHNVKMDFRDFDFDDDGVTEGCSGHTAALPVCIRFWLDDARFIAWVFEEYPVADDPATVADERTVGRGKYKILLDKIYGVGWEIAVQYGETRGASEGKGYDAYLKGSSDGALGFVFFGKEARFWYQHMKVAREGPETSAYKSAESNDRIEFSDDGSAYIAFKGTERYVEGFDSWAGSVYHKIVGNPLGENDEEAGEQDLCALISTGVAILPELCENVNGHNIRIGVDPLFPEDGHPFIVLATDADVAFPADFSAAPPADFDSLPKL